jgi:hypothetical protein
MIIQHPISRTARHHAPHPMAAHLVVHPRIDPSTVAMVGAYPVEDLQKIGEGQAKSISSPLRDGAKTLTDGARTLMSGGPVKTTTPLALPHRQTRAGNLLKTPLAGQRIVIVNVSMGGGQVELLVLAGQATARVPPIPIKAQPPPAA